MHSAPIEQSPYDHEQLPAPPRLIVLRAPGALRTSVESFIQSVYASSYGATIREFAPQLVCLKANGKVIAAAGYRLATEPLFLERYLDRPVEQLLGSSRPVERRSIAEVGHLSSLQLGASRQLLAELAAHLHAEGVEWVVSTVTAPLRQVFIRLKVGAHVIGAAPAERLGPMAADWGTYYDHEPLVMAGHLPTAAQALALRLEPR
jgi:hypothetical protein